MKFLKRFSSSFGKRSTSSKDTDSSVDPCDTSLPENFSDTWLQRQHAAKTVCLSSEDETMMDEKILNPLSQFSDDELIEELMRRLGDPPSNPPPEPKPKKKRPSKRVVKKRAPKQENPIQEPSLAVTAVESEPVYQPVPVVEKKTPLVAKTMQQILEESPVFRKYQKLCA